MKAHTMTVNFYLDRKPEQMENRIFMYIRGIGGTIKIHTGERIEPKFWDATKQCAKRSFTGSPELNSYLSVLKERVQKAYRIKKSGNPEVSFAELKSEMIGLFKPKSHVYASKQFFESLTQFIEVKEAEKKPRTILKYKSLKAHLEKFQKDKNYSITFENIHLEFYEKFVAFLMKDLKQTNNTIGKYISTLKTFLHWATDRKYNTGTDYIKFKAPNEKVDIIYLTEAELLSIYNLDLTGHSLEKIRDVFCFGCFTGQRFSDINNLKKEDIRFVDMPASGEERKVDRVGMWYLRTDKTKDIIEIPLNDYAIEIVQRYWESDTFLPTISQQKTNDYVKKLGEMAKIEEPISLTRYRGAEKLINTQPKHEFITTHTARRTFVTLSLEKGMRPETVMEITGHKDYKTFKKYIKLTSKVKTVEMRQIWKK